MPALREALQHLLLCRDILWHLLPEAFRQEIEQSIAKTTVLLPHFGDCSEALASLARNYSKGTIDYTKWQEMLQALLEAIQKQQICEVSYRASSNKSSQMAIAPLRLIAYQDRLYVKGRLEKALVSPDRYFDPLLAVHRIQRLKVTGRAFDRLKNGTKRNGKTLGFMLGEALTVKVRFQAAGGVLCCRADLERRPETHHTARRKIRTAVHRHQPSRSDFLDHEFRV